jgi:hypothetical protein
MQLSPLIKGIITAAAVIGFSLLAYFFIDVNSKLHYLVYGVYAAGIVWTLVAYSLSPSFTGKFGDSFNIGFRCFIVATFLVVAYIFVFNKLHPEFAQESAKFYKEQLLAQKDNSKTPDEIEKSVSSYKNGYNMAVVYGSIFGYLILGAVVTAFTSLILTRRKY